MRAQLVRIGNSQGVRLPKAVIEEAGLGHDLEVIVEGGAVVIRPRDERRSGWAEDARACHAAGEDQIHDWDAAIADGDWR